MIGAVRAAALTLLRSPLFLGSNIIAAKGAKNKRFFAMRIFLFPILMS
jgi:hypothetical protein